MKWNEKWNEILEMCSLQCNTYMRTHPHAHSYSKYLFSQVQQHLPPSPCLAVLEIRASRSCQSLSFQWALLALISRGHHRQLYRTFKLTQHINLMTPLSLFFRKRHSTWELPPPPCLMTLLSSLICYIQHCVTLSLYNVPLCKDKSSVGYLWRPEGKWGRETFHFGGFVC